MHCPNEYWERMKNGKPFNPSEEMQYEAFRLASFVNWPLWAQKRPGQLSEKGFYYSGEGDRVVCHSCKAELAKWSVSDDIDRRHKKISPECAVVNGANSRDHSSEDVTLAEINSYNEEQPDRSEGLEGAEKLLEELQSLTVNNENVFPETPSVQEAGTSPVDELNLSFVKYENYRLRTFTGKWPTDSFMSPAELAKAGFYFMSSPDHVKCAFCGGELFNWKPSDVPMTEHKTHFPRCGFVKGRNVGNVTARDETLDPYKKSKKTTKNMTPSVKFGIMTDKPKHPEFAIESARLDTFQIWPKKDSISPAALAKAGFFYVGYSDNVKCFFCDGGLRNWDPKDDPLYEHARWFSRCGYIKLQVGEEVINNILSETGKGNFQNVRTQLPKQPGVTNREDDKRIQSLVMMGFEVEMIKRVIEEKVEATGKDFDDIDDLLESLWEEQQKTTNNHAWGISKGTTVAEKKTQVEQRNTRAPDRRVSVGTASAGAVSAGTASAGAVSAGTASAGATSAGTASAGATSAGTASAGAVSAVGDSEIVNDEEQFAAAVQSVSLSSVVTQNEEVQSLLRQYQRIQDERTCKVCMDEECTVVFLPCGHLVCCPICAPALRNCPICRTLIRGSVRISKDT